VRAEAWPQLIDVADAAHLADAVIVRGRRVVGDVGIVEVVEFLVELAKLDLLVLDLFEQLAAPHGTLGSLGIPLYQHAHSLACELQITQLHIVRVFLLDGRDGEITQSFFGTFRPRPIALHSTIRSYAIESETIESFL